MSEADSKISRRTLARGASWAAPAIAVTAMAPNVSASVATTTTTLPPCLSALVPEGGTYPVTYDLSGCTADGTHWDFRFKITAATQDGTDCNCSDLRITVFDNPKRSRLWIVGMTPDPSTNQNNSPQLYIQKILSTTPGPNNTAFFPAQGDTVRRVDNNASIGNIEVWGGSNDAMHVLMNADGTLPCNATGPMAFYKVECRQSATSPWVQVGEIGQIWPTVPMIQSTVCVVSTTGNDRYRLGVSVLVSAGLQASDFVITDVRRNSNENSPTSSGSSVYSGPDVTLGAGTTFFNTTTEGTGTSLWIEFTTDGGLNHSWIRVPTTTTNCGPFNVSATNDQAICPAGNRTINVQWTGTSTKIQYRVAQPDGTFSGDWTNQDDSATPGTISLSDATTKCRAVQVRLCNGGNNQTCTSASEIVTVPAVPSGNRSSEPQTVEEQRLDQQDVTTESLDQPLEQTPAVEQAPVVEEAPAVTPEPPSTETPVPTE